MTRWHRPPPLAMLGASTFLAAARQAVLRSAWRPRAGVLAGPGASTSDFMDRAAAVCTVFEHLMVRDALARRVREFLNVHLTRVGDLEVLLALIEGGNRWWDAHSMAIRIGMDPAGTRESLEALAAHNLLDIRVSDEVRYRLHPGSDELARNLEALSAAYRASPTAVVNYVMGVDRALTEAQHRRRTR